MPVPRHFTHLNAVVHYCGKQSLQLEFSTKNLNHSPNFLVYLETFTLVERHHTEFTHVACFTLFLWALHTLHFLAGDFCFLGHHQLFCRAYVSAYLQSLLGGTPFGEYGDCFDGPGCSWTVSLSSASSNSSLSHAKSFSIGRKTAHISGYWWIEFLIDSKGVE